MHNLLQTARNWSSSQSWSRPDEGLSQCHEIGAVPTRQQHQRKSQDWQQNDSSFWSQQQNDDWERNEDDHQRQISVSDQRTSPDPQRTDSLGNRLFTNAHRNSQLSELVVSWPVQKQHNETAESAWKSSTHQINFEREQTRRVFELSRLGMVEWWKHKAISWLS